MLKITDIKCLNKPPSAAQLMSRRLRKAYIRRQRSKEYKRLKNIIPTVANKKKVDKVTSYSLLFPIWHCSGWNSLTIKGGKLNQQSSYWPTHMYLK